MATPLYLIFIPLSHTHVRMWCVRARVVHTWCACVGCVVIDVKKQRRVRVRVVVIYYVPV